jgi:long-chain acyl-CoA synthetase
MLARYCVTIARWFGQVAGRSGGLQGFEMVHAVHLEPEEFSVDNGALTPTNKLRRYHLGKTYAAQIAAMYDEIARD